MRAIDEMFARLIALTSRTWSTTVTINETRRQSTIPAPPVNGGGGGGRPVPQGINIQQTIVNEMVPLDAGKIATAMQVGMEGALAQIGF